MSLGLLVILVVMAIGAGAYAGGFANRRLEAARDRRGDRSAADKVRETATGSFVRLWKWRRDRKRKE